MTGLDPSVAEWLVTEDGLQAVADATAQLDAVATDGSLDSAHLAVTTRLRATLPEQHVPATIDAALARIRARRRWPDADRLLFTRDALEQASDPAVSAWRARRFPAGDVVDLCAGVGGDTLALAASGRRVTAVDLDPARLTLLAHNARVRGVEVITVVGDALRVTLPAGTHVHADPGRRRADGTRVRRLRDHLPPVADLVTARDDTPSMGVVLSPAVDLDDPDLRALSADGTLEFVAIGDRLVEAVLWLGALADPTVAAIATIVPTSDAPSTPIAGAAGTPDAPVGTAPDQIDITPPHAGTPVPPPGRVVTRARPRGPVPETPVGPPQGYLVEVAAPAVRARLHDHIGREIGAHRIARTRALLTTDRLPPSSPWYLVRPVLAVLPPRPRAVRAWLRDHVDHPPLEIAVHGMDVEVTDWWRALGRPPRGPTGWRVELVRLDDGAVALVTGPRA